MKRSLLICSTVLLVSACTPEPNVAVRIDCGEHNDEGLQTTINGKAVGDCPIDMLVHAGDLTVTARKDNEDASYLYGEAKMTLAENAMKRIKLDIKLALGEEYYFRKATSLEGMQQYLEKIPDGERRRGVVDKIEQYYFDKTTDLAGMQQYLEKLSDGKRRSEVVDKIEQYYFDKTTDLVGIQQYLDRLPDGGRKNEVSNKLDQYYFDRAVDIASMQQYLEKMPEGKYSEDVKNKLQAEQQRLLEEKEKREILLENELYKKATTIAGMRNYLDRFPSGKWYKEINQKFESESERKLKALAPALIMVKIPAGHFNMGGGSSDEEPVRRVNLKVFAIGKYEVTFAQYDVFAKATRRELSDDGGGGRGNHPAGNVSWEDATAYAAWLSKETGKKFRLPTEAEWEYAARAGSTTDYSWGDDIDCTKARYGRSGRLDCDSQSTAAVGSYAANQFGLYDMHGNVWEWVQDCWNDSYAGAPVDGSAWTSGNCGRRVVRGGSWFSPWVDLRSSYRNHYVPSSRYSYFGFRLVQVL